MCSAKITPMILMNTERTENTFPLKAILANMPNINNGNRGTIMFSINKKCMFAKIFLYYIGGRRKAFQRVSNLKILK